MDNQNSAHSFFLKGSWTGGLAGNGMVTTEGFESAISVPHKLKGPGLGTNPEELLLSAAASCYLITLAAILGYQPIEISRISLDSEITVTTEGGLSVQKIVHRPKVELKKNVSAEIQEKIMAAFLRAETACLIAKALKGNVVFEIKGEVLPERHL
jgi:peroxiredoxin-like protein